MLTRPCDEAFSSAIWWWLARSGSSAAWSISSALPSGPRHPATRLDWAELRHRPPSFWSGVKVLVTDTARILLAWLCSTTRVLWP